MTPSNSFCLKSVEALMSHRHCCVFLIPAGGESVGRLVVYNIKFRHLKPGRYAKFSTIL